MKQVHTIAGVLGVMAVVTAWALVTPRPRDGKKDVGRATENDRRTTEGTADLGPLPRDHWELDERRTYTADLHTNLKNDDGAEIREMRLDGSFEIALTPYEKKSGHTLVRVDLRPKRVTSTQQQQQRSLMDQLQEQYRDPLAIQIDDRGKVEQVYWEPREDLSGLGFALGILSGLQFVAPESDTQRAWSVKETESSGKYTAEYSRTGVSTVLKLKTEFNRKAGGSMEVVAPSRITSSASYEIGASGIPAKVDGKYVSALTISGRAMQTSSSLALSLLSIEKIKAEPVALVGRQSTTLAGNDVAPPLGRAHYEQLAQGHTIGSALTALRALSPQQSDERAQMLLRLEAILRVQGSAAVAEAARAVRDLERDADAELVMGALHASETPEAQQALIALAGDEALGMGRRDTALIDMGLHQKPTAEALSGLRAMSEDATLEPELRDTALLAMGGAARHADPAALADSHTVDYLMERLEGARGDKGQILVLEALGNAGGDRILDPMKQALQSDDEATRESAANGLRHVPGGDADTLLSRIAATDPSARVRARAVSSMNYRKLTDETRTMLTSSLEKDSDAEVRIAALDVMSKYIEDDGDLAAAVVEASNSDPAERVRQRANAILTGGSPSGGEAATSSSAAAEPSDTQPATEPPTPRVPTTHGSPQSTPEG